MQLQTILMIKHDHIVYIIHINMYHGYTVSQVTIIQNKVQYVTKDLEQPCPV